MKKEIKRFDKTEFEVLKHAHPDGCGYYPSEPHKSRAFKLMKEGILIDNPFDNWNISGWKLTRKGLFYYNKFMKRLQERHGHVWMTNKDCDPEDYKGKRNDKYANEINEFAMSEGNHNGPRCKKCGYGFCHHCLSEFDVRNCDKKESIKDINKKVKEKKEEIRILQKEKVALK